MDLEAVDNTQLEPPETPAPIFAARAIKHAIFGTPAPPETVRPARVEPKADLPAFSRPLPPDFGLKNAVDPDKPRLPGGILSTPGTVKDRKTVSFGAQVVDNEGKKSDKAGLPSNCPGKFPSPWTPKVDGLAEEPEERPSSSSKLTAKLYEARASSKRTDSKAQPQAQPQAQPPPGPKPRAKDDGDVTIDVMEPRSESGRYWKEQFLSYAFESDREARKIIRKQQIAKEYARQKDTEALELTEKLETERKRHAQREKELEAKNKDYKERLRQAMAENFQSSTEIAMLKRRLAALEGEAVPDLPADYDLPKTELEHEFDQMMLDPQEAGHYMLDATPVNGRSYFVTSVRGTTKPTGRFTKASTPLYGWEQGREVYNFSHTCEDCKYIGCRRSLDGERRYRCGSETKPFCLAGQKARPQSCCICRSTEHCSSEAGEE
ncbi:hypothetical protein SLS58_005658 [Diplodia intermedia]|uniref:Spindle pole body-associated protein cut12 domain-containing protein n=1 Tax=Diplodia intermedia TaxID=856260 RepID=A0ABR3TQB5_9PEZI